MFQSAGRLGLRQEMGDGRIIEVLILGANDVCFADHRRLHDNNVVDVADGYAQHRNACGPVTMSSMSWRASPWELSLARTKIVVSRTILTGVDDRPDGCAA